MISSYNTDKVIAIIIEKLKAYQANKISDKHLEHFDKIAEMEAQWEQLVLSEKEEEVMELAWQLKKMEAKLLELGWEVFDFQRKVEELQVAVNNLQFSVDTKL